MDLPDPLAGYFAAANAGDVDRILAFFAIDATIEDKKKDHTGHPAIRRWATHARQTYNFRSEPFHLEGDPHHPVVHARVDGDFPGSPVDLAYHFEIADGLIKALAIR